jgi:biotin carboxyl carrier protein
MAEIRAEMVGTVLVLESMKMELPVGAGTPASLVVAKGDLVQQGDLLGVVE